MPLDGWRDRPDKKIYVWFDAVVGYLSASIEWAQRTGDPDAWRPFWQDPDAAAYYFMGKDNIVFHAEIWPAMLFGYSGIGAKGGEPGSLGALNRPYEVVSSEFLTMEGKQVLLLPRRGHLRPRRAVPLRRRRAALLPAVAGPENQDTDFTWSEFLPPQQRRARRQLGQPGQPVGLDGREELRRDPGAGRADRRRPRDAGRRRGHAFGTVGELLERSRQKAAINEAMRRGRRRQQVPLRPGAVEAGKTAADPERMATILHVALQVVDDAKTLLTPFLPTSSTHGARAAAAAPEPVGARCRELVEVDEETAVGSPSYSGAHRRLRHGGARWESPPLPVGRPLQPPKPVFTKLDASIVDEELARPDASGAHGEPAARHSSVRRARRTWTRWSTATAGLDATACRRRDVACGRRARSA